MMLPGSGFRVFVAVKPVDFRKGMDGLAAVVQNELALDPFCGAAFVFRPKRGDRVKILLWDGTGLVMSTSVSRAAVLFGRRCATG